MQPNNVSFVPPMGFEGNIFGSNGIDTTLYVQLLLVKEYDDQMKDSAQQIRIGNKLKQEYRLHKQAIGDLYSKPRDKDGKIELTQSEVDMLEWRPFHSWDQGKNKGQGGVKTIKQYQPVDKKKKVSSGPMLAAINEKYAQKTQKITYLVNKEVIEGAMERAQMEIDNLNGNGELMSLTLQTLTNQRKIAFETVSNILSKSSEATNNIARNIAR